MSSAFHWQYRLRCSDCKQAHPMLVGAALDNTEPSRKTGVGHRVICPTCGGLSWNPPMVGRRVVLFFDPRTWFTATWEWREDTAIPFPASRNNDKKEEGP